MFNPFWFDNFFCYFTPLKNLRLFLLPFLTFCQSPDFSIPTSLNVLFIYIVGCLCSRLVAPLGWQQCYSGLWRCSTHQTRPDQTRPDQAKTEMALKSKMSPNLKCHQNLNVTKTEMLQNWYVPKTEMSPKLKYFQN